QLADPNLKNQPLSRLLDGLDQQKADRLAALLTNDRHMTADKLTMNDANLARMNALLRPENQMLTPQDRFTHEQRAAW
ncbi:hypothetical protein, partial [Enterococcus faecium]